jgi:hypothetical protein
LGYWFKGGLIIPQSIKISTRSAHTISSRCTRIHTLTRIHIMNMLALNSPELDVIYDALSIHRQCTDDDSVADTCNTIIQKIHMYSIMNDDVLGCIRYKGIRDSQ